MTATENKQIMQALFAEMARGNTRALVDLMDEDFTWKISGTAPWAKTYVGKAAVVGELLQPLTAQFSTQYRNTASRFIADDDLVVVECQGEVTTTSGKPYNNKYCFIFRLENGRLKEVTEYMDTELVTATLDL